MFGISSIVGEETNPVLGGIAVRHGRASLALVVTAVALGTWAASLALYFVGRWRIDWVLRRWPGKHQLIEAALAVVKRHPWRASLAIRFAYGLRLPLPIACGAARLPLSLYAIASGVSCWLWAAVFSYLGLAFGRSALALLHFADRLDVKLALVALVLAVLLAVVTRRRLIAERTASVLAGERIPLMTTAERRATRWPARDRAQS